MVGKMHNEALAYTRDFIASSPYKISSQGIIDLAYKFSIELLSSDPEMASADFDSIPRLTFDEAKFILEDITNNNLDKFIANLNMDSRLRIKLKDLVDSVIKEAGSEMVNYGILYDGIVKFEDEIMSIMSYKITQKDACSLLSFTSTLRYSLAYWENTYSDSVEDEAAPGGKIKKWLKVAAVALSDAAGAVAGAATGSLIGPVSAVAGAICTGTAASCAVGSILY